MDVLTEDTLKVTWNSCSGKSFAFLKNKPFHTSVPGDEVMAYGRHIFFLLATFPAPWGCV